MVIHVKYNPNVHKTNDSVHYMPCLIHLDGKASVSEYFQRYIGTEGTALTASFRGRPLNGQEIQLPSAYKGLVLQEVVKPLAEDAERNLHVVNTFKSITYWNWDKVPSRDDALISALDWIDIAEALHAPVTDVTDK